MMSAGTCDLVIPQLPSGLTTTGHIMPSFQENLVGVGPVCDANCTVKILKHTVNIYSPNGTPTIKGCHETDGPFLWRMSLLNNPEDVPPLYSTPESHKTSLKFLGLMTFSVWKRSLITSMQLQVYLSATHSSNPSWQETSRLVRNSPTRMQPSPAP